MQQYWYVKGRGYPNKPRFQWQTLIQVAVMGQNGVKIYMMVVFPNMFGNSWHITLCIFHCCLVFFNASLKSTASLPNINLETRHADYAVYTQHETYGEMEPGLSHWQICVSVECAWKATVIPTREKTRPNQRQLGHMEWQLFLWYTLLPFYFLVALAFSLFFVTAYFCFVYYHWWIRYIAVETSTSGAKYCYWLEIVMYGIL